MEIAYIVPLADLLIFGVIGLFIFYGFKRGALKTLYSILRIYFSFIISIFFYERLALLLQAIFDMSSGVARIICFTTLFVALLVTMWAAGVFLRRRVAKDPDASNGLSRAGGGILGLLESILIISIIIMVVNFYPIPEGTKFPLEGAISYKIIKYIAPGIETFTIGPISRIKDAADMPDSGGSDESDSEESESDTP